MAVDPVRIQRTESWESWYKHAFSRFDLSLVSIVTKSTFPLYSILLPSAILLDYLLGNGRPLAGRVQAPQLQPNPAQSQPQQSASSSSSSTSSGGVESAAVRLLRLAHLNPGAQSSAPQDMHEKSRMASPRRIPSAIQTDAPSMSSSSPSPNSRQYLRVTPHTGPIDPHALGGVEAAIVQWSYDRSEGDRTSDDSGPELSSGGEADFREARSSASPTQGSATPVATRPASSSPLQTIDEKRRAVAFGSFGSSGSPYRLAPGSGSPTFNRPMANAHQYAAASSSSSLTKSQSLDSLSSNKS